MKKKPSSDCEKNSSRRGSAFCTRTRWSGIDTARLGALPAAVRTRTPLASAAGNASEVVDHRGARRGGVGLPRRTPRVGGRAGVFLGAGATTADGAAGVSATFDDDESPDDTVEASGLSNNVESTGVGADGSTKDREGESAAATAAASRADPVPADASPTRTGRAAAAVLRRTRRSIRRAAGFRVAALTLSDPELEATRAFDAGELSVARGVPSSRDPPLTGVSPVVPVWGVRSNGTLGDPAVGVGALSAPVLRRPAP
jgi:hypothetical protein